jgi:hypothetical protein
MRPFNKIAGALALAGLLASCSEYLDHRDTVSLNGGNAVAQNKIVQMVDPWPRESANRNIAHNGYVMESAMTRYRNGQVIAPRGTTTSNSYSAPPAANASAAANNSAPLGPTVTQPVK